MMSRIALKKGDILKIYTDGAARGNPGPAAYAFLFVHNDVIIHKGFEYIEGVLCKYKSFSLFLLPTSGV